MFINRPSATTVHTVQFPPNILPLVQVSLGYWGLHSVFKFSKSIRNHNRGGAHRISICSMLLLSHFTAAVSNTLHKNVY